MKATEKINAEVFVVDNSSADGSVQMIKEKFSQVRLLVNTTNVGFASANNQAIIHASGKYILLLNPDTVVQEDTFTKCLEYMDAHPEAGCLGVKMIDGKGNYLPESKRALPVPEVAFYKIFGLSALFPRSPRFAKYHLGYLSPDELHRVDVISGAFMFVRKSVLEKTGLLDEDYFMYGEDIDLSYRINKAGYENIYFPETTIIHYKGESTKKGSINYVIVFYRAMIIFAGKHFKARTFRLYSFFIHLAIVFRASLSILGRFLRNVITPVLDAAFIYSGYALLLPLWEKYHFGSPGYYPPSFMKFVVPGYIVIWIFSLFISTGYEKKVKFADMARGILYGTVLILLIYALLPETWRFSRISILMGTLWVLISAVCVRHFLSRVYSDTFSFQIFRRKKRILIIGNKEEGERVYAIIRQAQVIPDLVGFVDPKENRISHGFLGHIGQIDEIVRVNRVDELVFCASGISSRQIIRTMLKFTDTGVDFKIAPPESLSVIGSNSHEARGEIYLLHFNTLSRLLNRRKKRLFDLGCALFMLFFFPVLVFVVQNRTGLFRNIIGVLAGILSWVGYYQSTGGNHPGLPRIRPGVLTPLDFFGRNTEYDPAHLEQLNLSYAKDYRIMNDLRIIAGNVKQLGRISVNQ